MKRRLSDHDEWAFHRLAQVTDRLTGLRPGLERVWFRGGWAYASDSYRALVLPVEIEGEGRVHCHDALIGGTVEVVTEPVHYGDLISRIPKLATTPASSTATLCPFAVPALRKWHGRRPTSKEFGQVSPTCVATNGLAPLRDAKDVKYASGLTTALAVQAPYLASIALPLFEASDGDVSIGVTTGRAPVVLWCEDPLDGWGMVMPMRVAWPIPWEATR